MAEVTAVEIAASFRLDPKQLRQALRDENFQWHSKHSRWIADCGSVEEADMLRIAKHLSARSR